MYKVDIKCNCWTILKAHYALWEYPDNYLSLYEWKVLISYNVSENIYFYTIKYLFVEIITYTTLSLIIAEYFIFFFNIFKWQATEIFYVRTYLCLYI